MITKDGKNTAIENLTAENYVVPAGEERFYHAVVEVKVFDQKTGKRLSRPRLQKFGKRLFEGVVRDQLLKMGYDITILHDPRKWEAQQAKIKADVATKAAAEKAENERVAAERAAEEAKAKAKAEAEKKAAERAEIKAELLAELKAAGLLDVPGKANDPAEPTNDAAKPANDANEGASAEPAKKAGRPKKETE